MTIGEAEQAGVTSVRRVSDSPRLDVDVLLGHTIKQSRAFIIAHPNHRLSTKQSNQFKKLIATRANGRPIAYLVGQQEFFGLPIKVNEHVLIPRPATELIVQAVLDRVPDDKNIVIADIGTGSGAMAVALASNLPHTKILATDVSSAALQIARHNAKRLKLPNDIKFIRGHLLSPIKHITRPLIIVANLPYLTARQTAKPNLKHEPRSALFGGRGGLELVNQLIAQAATFKNLQGLILELDPAQIKKTKRRVKSLWPAAKIDIIFDGRRARGVAIWMNY